MDTVTLPALAADIETEHFDVVVVGAGLSGVNAGCRLKMHRPRDSFVILESRDVIGGTWDLFRYPGVRSDSDMHTLGYPFRPWHGDQAIAGGGEILEYVRETARAYGVDRAIRFGHRVVRASWSSAERRWTVLADRAGRVVSFTCNFLIMCSGYYDYAGGFTPEFPGIGEFGGQVVHPQAWPKGLEVASKRVVVIGSGATAVTLVPALAGQAMHVTMLQRSPTYIVSRPSRDALAARLGRYMPAGLAAKVVRWRNVLLTMYLFRMARRQPGRFKAGILKLVRAEVGPDYDVGTHFTPSYNPWDQRLCLVPDSDLFAAIRAGTASVVTDRIERFTPGGLRLVSGAEIEADIVVTATGLNLKFMGGMALEIDGSTIDPGSLTSYKGIMCSGIPNLVSVFGYVNASWTLKSDLTCRYACRLLSFMERRGYASVTPRLPEGGDAGLPFMDFSSGYVQRAIGLFPKQGARDPWRAKQNYLQDVRALRFGSLSDAALEFAPR